MMLGLIGDFSLMLLVVKAIGDGSETCLKIREDQRTLFDRFWARRCLEDLSMFGSTPGNLLDLHASGRRGRIEAAEELVEAERFRNPQPDI
jgi:hypothetical protein